MKFYRKAINFDVCVSFNHTSGLELFVMEPHSNTLAECVATPGAVDNVATPDALYEATQHAIAKMPLAEIHSRVAS